MDLPVYQDDGTTLPHSPAMHNWLVVALDGCRVVKNYNLCLKIPHCLKLTRAAGMMRVIGEVQGKYVTMVK